MATSEQEEGGQPGQQVAGQSKLNVITFDDDGESHYAVEDDAFSTFAQKKGLQEDNTEYSIVAIMGGQSGGKSTLLNLLFGTSFAVLESQERRGATTKGIWVSASEHNADTFVMDLEGTDSDEKEEALVETFARQASLFALAVAEVLIINVWAHDIGRRKAQNLVVLETIFEANLSLFQETHSNKTILLFTIRDHNQAKNPIEVLKDVIMRNITGIWDRIEKPEFFKDKTLQDVFIVQFVSLRNLEYEPDGFCEDVKNLRQRFEDPTREDSFFNTDIHFKKTQEMPISLMNKYLKQLWQTIANSEQLNVVSQKEALVERLCEEYSNSAWEGVQPRIRELARVAEEKLVDDFGGKASGILTNAIAAYDKSAFISEQQRKNGAGQLHKVRIKRRDQLEEKAVKELEMIFQRQMAHAKTFALDTFDATLRESLPSDGTAASGFSSLVEDAEQSALQKFSQIEKDSILKDHEWTTKHISGDLVHDIKQRTESQKERQLELLAKELDKKMNGHYMPQVGALAKKADDELWRKLHLIRREAIGYVEMTLKDKLPGLGGSAADIEQRVNNADSTFVDLAKAKVVEQLDFIDQILMKRFDKGFRLEKNGVPRIWDSSMDVQRYYTTAKEDTLKLLEMYERFQLVDDGGDERKWHQLDDIDAKIIAADQVQAITDKFELSTAGAFREVTNQIAQTKAEVPVWLLVLLLALGWNEATDIFYSPVKFMMLALIGIAVYIVFRLGLAGPVTAILQNGLKTATEQVNVYMNPPQQQQQGPPEGAPRRRRTSVPNAPSSEEIVEKRRASHRRVKTGIPSEVKHEEGNG